MFQGTQRSLRTKSGLDYTKIVLVDKDNYLDNRRVVVDQDEYIEVQKNLKQIAEEAVVYVDGYIEHVTGRSVMHPKQFERRYKYSTLPYFHDIMGIEVSE